MIRHEFQRLSLSLRPKVVPANKTPALQAYLRSSSRCSNLAAMFFVAVVSHLSRHTRERALAVVNPRDVLSLQLFLSCSYSISDWCSTLAMNISPEQRSENRSHSQTGTLGYTQDSNQKDVGATRGQTVRLRCPFPHALLNLVSIYPVAS